MDDGSTNDVDGIDREILQILLQDPRMPYSEIASRLEAAGYQMSAEGVRHRVVKLFDESEIFLLTSPQARNWEVLRLNVVVKDEPGATEATFEQLGTQNFWLVCRGFGSVDIHGVATVANVAEADALVTAVRALDEVTSVSYFLETDRITNIHDYMGG
ncbi:hypothetical protein C482_02911 [Natrialba chahannaoensis JCM 10990]|uniref:HTH asnC-type domain-containing protein n=1 Tax=Natrialba chahannaoensis JCM 10990 TaxID=1227492 RepID=M0B1Y8_9EURY|nr:AsnC family transcriptional regulator [Natrialba chahannaoensis]ELZ04921.1 hypothetical protein C482_02911 [Natrialba chahannaoensis JCM 10990]